MNRGYVKLWRKTLDSRVFANADLLKVWVWCLCKASHEPKWVSISTGRGMQEIQIEAGQFVFGRKTAAKELDMKLRTVYDRIQKLKSLQNLDINSNTHYSIVTICNWVDYQQMENEGQQATRTPSAHHPHTIQHNQTLRELREEEKSTPPPPLRGASDPTPFENLIEMYHRQCPTMPKTAKPGENLKKQLRRRWLEYPDFVWWESYFNRVAASDFLTGRKNDFIANLIWLTGPKNMEKVLAGQYDNRDCPDPSVAEAWRLIQERRKRRGEDV